MEAFIGTWTFVESDNFEPYLKGIFFKVFVITGLGDSFSDFLFHLVFLEEMIPTVPTFFCLSMACLIVGGGVGASVLS